MTFGEVLVEGIIRDEPVRVVEAMRDLVASKARDMILDEGCPFKTGFKPPLQNPGMRPTAPAGEARFVAKHCSDTDERVTDGDESTLDDELFSAKSIERSVPGPHQEKNHGHVPTGVDASVYENLSLDEVALLNAIKGSDIGRTAMTGAKIIARAGAEALADTTRRGMANYIAKGNGEINRYIAASISPKTHGRFDLNRALASHFGRHDFRDLHDFANYLKSRPDRARFGTFPYMFDDEESNETNR